MLLNNRCFPVNFAKFVLDCFCLSFDAHSPPFDVVQASERQKLRCMFLMEEYVYLFAKSTQTINIAQTSHNEYPAKR